MTVDLSVMCPVMEIPAATCAHCRRLPDVPADDRVLGRPFAAAYAGSCVDCREPFDVGDRIRSDGDHGYVGPCCEEDA